MVERGKHIVIEGGEGSGKTTHTRLLGEFLNLLEIDFYSGRDPGGVSEAEKIRALLKSPDFKSTPLVDLFMFGAARALFFHKIVIPSLNSGKWVLSDRSGISTSAYQGYGEGLDKEQIGLINSMSTQGYSPDLVFILDVPAKIGLKMEVSPDRFALKGEEYHNRVNEGYRDIARQNPSFVLIPYRANGLEEMQNQIRLKVIERFCLESLVEKKGLRL